MDVDAGKAVVAVLASVLQKLVNGNDKVSVERETSFSEFDVRINNTTSLFTDK